MESLVFYTCVCWQATGALSPTNDNSSLVPIQIHHDLPNLARARPPKINYSMKMSSAKVFVFVAGSLEPGLSLEG